MTMTVIPCNFSFFAALLWQVGECVWHEPARYKYKLVSWWKFFLFNISKFHKSWMVPSPYPVSKYIFKLNPSICSENTFYILVTTFAEKNQILLWKICKYMNVTMQRSTSVEIEKMIKISICSLVLPADDNKKGKLHKKVLFWKKVTMKLKI